MLDFVSLSPTIINAFVIVGLCLALSIRPLFSRQNQTTFLCIAGFLCLAFIHFCFSYSTTLTIYDLKLALLCLVALSISRANVEGLKYIVFFLLILNALICCYEIAATYYSVANYLDPSELTGIFAPSPYVAPIIRKISGPFIFIRPHGLFASIHLSGFANTALMLLSYLNWQHASRKTAHTWRLVFILALSITIVSGTMQYWVVALFFAIWNFRSVPIKIAIIFSSVFLLIAAYIRFYGIEPISLNDDTSMVRILLATPKYLISMPIQNLLFGGWDVNEFHLHVDVIDADKVDDVGIIRFVFQFGLVGFILFQLFLLSGMLKIKAPQSRHYYLAFYFAFSTTLIHVYNVFSLIGGLIFIFLPYMLNAHFPRRNIAFNPRSFFRGAELFRILHKIQNGIPNK